VSSTGCHASLISWKLYLSSSVRLTCRVTSPGSAARTGGSTAVWLRPSSSAAPGSTEICSVSSPRKVPPEKARTTTECSPAGPVMNPNRAGSEPVANGTNRSCSRSPWAMRPGADTVIVRVIPAGGTGKSFSAADGLAPRSKVIITSRLRRASAGARSGRIPVRKRTRGSSSSRAGAPVSVGPPYRYPALSSGKRSSSPAAPGAAAGGSWEAPVTHVGAGAFDAPERQTVRDSDEVVPATASRPLHPEMASITPSSATSSKLKSRAASS
jgi:hypothetical protein